jgi:hypothetical protein
LNWHAEKISSANKIQFADATGRKIDIELREGGSEPIGRVVLNSGGIEFVVAPAKCGDLLEVWRTGHGEKPVPQMMPAQNNDLVSLMSQELMRGGPHRVYLHAVNCVRDLL